MNFKRIIAGLMAVCVMGAVLPFVSGKTVDNAVITARADGEYTVGTYEELTYYVYSGYIGIKKCSGFAESVVIPDEIDGLPVTSIGDRAFENCFELTEITIPDSVTRIEERAFYCCQGLKEITIPNSVTWIGSAAFSDCIELTKITIPDSVKGIGWSAFSYTPWLGYQREDDPFVIVNGILIDGKICSGNIAIPNSVTSIGDGAFSYCSELTGITIPDNVTSIGSSAFYQCTGLTEITIPESVTSIEYSAFSGCTGLEEITIYNPICKIYDSIYTISDTATIYGYDKSTAQEYAAEYERKFVSLGKNSAMPDKSLKLKNYGGYIAITGCDETAVSVEIPAEIYGVPVTSIGAYAFKGCSGLTSLEIPDGVTSISWGAFEDCSGLTSINIPDSVTSIGDEAFKECSGLTSINISKGVKSIGLNAFIACSKLESITILNPDCDIYDDKGTFAANAFMADDGKYYLLGIGGEPQGYSGTIYGYDNSTAQAYAEKYNITFVSLGAAPEKDPEMGDIDGDGKVDSSDASLVLTEYALLSTGKNGNFSEDEKKLADLNKDGTIDSSDASLILAYYSHVSTGGTDSIEEFLTKQGY